MDDRPPASNATLAGTVIPNDVSHPDVVGKFDVWPVC
jgi:hypothetical protein